MDLGHLDMHHLMLSPQNIALRRIFPWAYSIQKILHNVRSVPFLGTHLLIGSDYGGNHSSSKYKTYGFLVADNEPSQWLIEQKEIRTKILTDSRRMSFKRLGDPQKQKALVPLLQAADGLNGHLVVFAVHKSIRLGLMKKGDVKVWRKLFDLSAKWNHLAFEEAFRKTHFFALLTGQWSKRLMDVTWISDQDEFVANDDRLDDAQKLAAKLATLYSPHSLGIFAMNTTKIDDDSREYEDFVAIPDMAAGMISELCNSIEMSKNWQGFINGIDIESDTLQFKSELLADWFWFDSAKLRKTCIVIDKYKNKGRVFKLDQFNI